MSRPLMLVPRCLSCVLLLGLPATGRAQFAPSREDIDAQSARKELARALFESTQSKPRDLARARLEAAWTQVRERYTKFRAGAPDARLDRLLEAAALLAEAGLGVLENPTAAEKMAPLAARWLYTQSIEQIVEAKYRHGRASLADLLQARLERLDAEIKLRNGEQKVSVPDLIASLPLDRKEFLDVMDAKEAAKHAFETSRTDLPNLRRVRVESAQAQLRERYEKYLAGAQDATLDLLLKSIVSLAEAELAALDNPMVAQRLKPRAVRWRYALIAERIVEEKHRVGRMSVADLAQAQHARLDAEIKLRQAEAGRKLSAPFESTLLHDPEEVPDVFTARDLAKRVYEAGQADLRTLALARAEAARTDLDFLLSWPGRGEGDSTLDLDLQAARHLLDAELAVHDGPAERLEAVQRYWEFTRETENKYQEKYRVGRCGMAHYAQTRCARLDAEIRLHKAQGEAQKK